ncbi:hypothetical protein BASA50_008449 [Batrachochytrium salamandrivorans]|uniref:Uncharacterized protein n=1 Tax=Batrachochytrium salamandrivorans TaxID=1357716 RepID=A0ABQ8F424_9FUNG|nr:hypothetical protein BASA60_000117 [Batrachochytrium salamandrivorans]KAH6579663.1 hypothetical protein BASA61_010095 [Batrachochytrium salamandrivorans]KAH6591850.1 hypothetical protein BASA50_008449 [Batrachochytrium salamandrivorans]KAH9245227.1 hypothetical protein BASA81_017301 [Batrachochytrium salamandrivorans]
MKFNVLVVAAMVITSVNAAGEGGFWSCFGGICGSRSRVRQSTQVDEQESRVSQGTQVRGWGGSVVPQGPAGGGLRSGFSQNSKFSQGSQAPGQQPGLPENRQGSGSSKGPAGGNEQQPAENAKGPGMPYIILKDGWGPESTQNPAENGQEPESPQGEAGNEQQPGSPQGSPENQQEPGMPQGPAGNEQKPESTQESPMSGSEPGSSEDFMDDDSGKSKTI